jgi:Mob1/phocein family
MSQLAGQQNDWIGKSSGFAPNFHSDVRSIIKQMFRCYAHLYHNHWDNPFWHINRHLELNSCFVHFVTVAMYYDLLSRKDMEPLQGLIDIFIAQGVIPREAVQQHTS